MDYHITHDEYNLFIEIIRLLRARFIYSALDKYNKLDLNQKNKLVHFIKIYNNINNILKQIDNDFNNNTDMYPLIKCKM